MCDVHFARHSSYAEELVAWLADRLDRVYAIGMHFSALASHLKETIEALPCFSDCVALASVLASVDGCCTAYNRRSHDCVFGMLMIAFLAC